MTTLLGEIVLFLIASAGIGFAMGWMLRSLRSASATSLASREGFQFRDGLSDEVHGLVTRLEEQDRGSKETISRMASEIEELRGLLENLPATHEEKSGGRKPEDEARRRAEAAMQELDQIKAKFEELNRKHQDLQTSYHKVADRIVEYEREKMVDRGARPRAQAATPPTVKPASDPRPAAEARKPEKKAPESAKTDLGEIERSGDAVIAAGIFVEDEPVKADRSAPRSKSVDPIQSKPSRKPEPAKPAAGGKKMGSTHPLTAIIGIPSDVRARLEVLGVTNNQQLLQKCATESGLHALCKSMGLKIELLSRWASAADLARLDCMRKEDTPDLINIGVESVQALANAKADLLISQLRSAPKSHGSATLEAVAKWIEEARTIEPVLRW